MALVDLANHLSSRIDWSRPSEPAHRCSMEIQGHGAPLEETSAHAATQ